MNAEMLVRKSQGPDPLREISKQITQSIDRADKMIRDLLDANLIRAGEQLPIEISPLDMVQVARDTVEELSSVHGARFVLHAPKEIRGGGGSESGIRRILENLCGNAIKYGDISPITISLSHNENSAVISVHNRGPTIPDEDQARLFDPFRRTLSAKIGKQKGWGLGLTLVKGIADAHGGKVSLKSSDESGTTFSVALPLDPKNSI